ncbi:hypothetical protein TNCV_1586611 [Trichonephila clavipes]|nr:hypothetical protein TNCV_1586611 [Trichonephila clavipes]
MNSSILPLKNHRVEGGRCMLNPSRAQTSYHWCGVIVRREGCQHVVLVTLPWFKINRSVAKSPRVAEKCDVNIHSLTHMSSLMPLKIHHTTGDARVKSVQVENPYVTGNLEDRSVSSSDTFVTDHDSKF